ncbi:MAG: hypothetical protein PVJ34_16840 [Anaerolineae bacterium]|jgi:hypothetical protein
MLTELTPFATILVLATLVEALIEHLVKPIFLPQTNGAAEVEEDQPTPLSPTIRDLLLRYCSAGLGMILCYAYDADLLALMGLHAAAPWIGSLITGILIGRGANFLHDFAGRWFGPGDPR